MAEFWVKYEDWSLEAVVKGASGAFAKIVDTETDSSYVHQHQHQHQPAHVQSNAVPEMSVNELIAAYKQFYRVAHSPEIRDKTQIMAKQDPICARKYKRRKKYKKVVMHVSAKGLASHDKWAWRKYGQKPIKSSPFPRSYYRCSSSKECLARKQVEQSYTDPGMFTITYTAEHCHSLPTKRSSLAGTVRHKIHYAPSISTTTTTTSAAHVSLRTLHEEQAMKMVKEEGRKQRDSSSTARDLIFDIDDFCQGLEDICEFVPGQSIIC